MKRIAELHKLSADHHLGLVLARRARLAAEGKSSHTPSEAWEEVGRKFLSELEPHFRIEEEYLVPPMEAMGALGLVERLNEEHKALREIVLDRSARTLSLLRHFGEILERHIRFEEREFFVTAEKLLPTELFKTIEKASIGTIPRT